MAASASKLVVSGDAARTAANILANESLFRLGFVGYLLNVACYLVVTALFYELFAPVNKTISLLAAFFSLMGCAIQASACLFLMATLNVLTGGPYLSVFRLEQLQALGLLFLKLHAATFNMGLVFFGSYCVLIGYLILQSIFLPRILGGLMVFGGLAWLTFMVPPLASSWSPYILVPGIVGEGSLTLWLLVMGVNAARRQEQASATRSRV